MTGGTGIKQNPQQTTNKKSIQKTINIYPLDYIRTRACFSSFHHRPLPYPYKKPDLYGNGFKTELQF